MEIAILVFLVLLNGLFAMSELAIVSAKKPRLKARADSGDAGAKAALKLLEDPSRLLSTVQIGITLIGIIAGAYGATAIADDLAPVLLGWFPTLSATLAGQLAFGIVIVLTTYLSLVLGELVPKRIALTAPETLAGMVAPPMALLAQASAPVVWVLKTSTEAVLRLVGAHRTKQADVTEEEIHSLIEEGHEAGLIETEEREMITGIMRLGDRTVRTIMTPRLDIVWLDSGKPRDETLRLIRDSGHSRFPVAEGGLDHLIGVTQTKELLIASANGAWDLKHAAHPPVIVPESMSVLRLLDTMRDNPVRMLFVADEYGVIQGLVTAADVLESIAGDAALSTDEAIDKPVQREDGSWLLDGMTPIDEFEQLMSVRNLNEEGEFDTLAGFVIHLMQRLPGVGDTAAFADLRFEIVDMDGRRIDKIIVRRVGDALEGAV
ncbi:MAG TPA: hemolysin family protein [Terricaulis sp.]|nr:hemolysin family protein [Terricaulis sp.]